MEQYKLEINAIIELKRKFNIKGIKKNAKCTT